MNGSRPNLRATLVALVLLVTCVGVMVLLSRAQPPKPRPQAAETSSEKLDSPREIQGVPCSGYARFSPDGRLAGCILSREHAFGAVVLPDNTQIRRFHPDLTPKDVHLGRDTVLDGHTCLGRGPGEWMAGFHANGRLAYCFLAEPETIDGVPCQKGSFLGELTGGVIVKLHDNGRLASCRLAADVTLDGMALEKGARVFLDAEGTLTPPERGGH